MDRSILIFQGKKLIFFKMSDRSIWGMLNSIQYNHRLLDNFKTFKFQDCQSIVQIVNNQPKETIFKVVQNYTLFICNCLYNVGIPRNVYQIVHEKNLFVRITLIYISLLQSASISTKQASKRKKILQAHLILIHTFVMNKFDNKEDSQKTADKKQVLRFFQCQACVILQRDNSDLRRDICRVLQQYRGQRSLNKSLVQQIQSQRQLVRLFELKLVQEQNAKQLLMRQYQKLVNQQQINFLYQKKNIQEFWANNLNQIKDIKLLKTHNSHQLSRLQIDIIQLQDQLKVKRFQNQICRQQLEKLISNHRLNSQQQLNHLDKINGMLAAINSDQNNLMKSLKTVNIKYRQQKIRRKNLMSIINSVKNDLQSYKNLVSQLKLIKQRLQDEVIELRMKVKDSEYKLGLAKQRQLKLQDQLRDVQQLRIKYRKKQEQLDHACKSQQQLKSYLVQLQRENSQSSTKYTNSLSQIANLTITNQNLNRLNSNQHNFIISLKKDNANLHTSIRQQLILLDQLKQQLVTANFELTLREQNVLQLLEQFRQKQILNHIQI